MTLRLLMKSATKAELLIYSDIGESWWGEGVTAKQVADELKRAGSVAEIDVRINSYGGDVFDGLAIYRQLVDHAARVTTYVDGIAASAASVVAMAGDEIVMAEAGTMMIHDAWTVAAGDAGDLRAAAERLDVTSQELAKLYAARAKRTETEMRDLMRAETWFTGEEALAAGLADRVAENFRAAAAALKPGHPFRNAPARLSARRQAANGLVAKQRAKLAAARA